MNISQRDISHAMSQVLHRRATLTTAIATSTAPPLVEHRFQRDLAAVCAEQHITDPKLRNTLAEQLRPGWYRREAAGALRNDVSVAEFQRRVAVQRQAQADQEWAQQQTSRRQAQADRLVALAAERQRVAEADRAAQAQAHAAQVERQRLEYRPGRGYLGGYEQREAEKTSW